MDELPITINDSVSNNDNDMSTLRGTQSDLTSLLTHTASFVIGFSSALLYTNIKLYIQQYKQYKSDKQHKKQLQLQQDYIKSQKRWNKLKKQLYYTSGTVIAALSLYMYNNIKQYRSDIKSNNVKSLNNSATSYNTLPYAQYKVVPA